MTVWKTWVTYPGLLVAWLVLGCGMGSAAELPEGEIARLRAQLAAQQKQLETLQRSIDAQQQMIERALAAPASLGNVASLSPMLPVAPAAMPAQKQPKPGASNSGNDGGVNPCDAPPDDNAVPPYLRVGATCIQPVGFMDLTAVWRDKTTSESIGSNFGGIPLSNSVPGAKLSQFRFSPQNSRLGFRADSNFKGSHITGYLEFDFLGSPAATNFTVTNGAVIPRLRLFWVDVRKDKWEFLGGQSWSMMTPNRKGISALPSDLFYSQVIDVNYVAGLTWTRQPGVRVLYHASDKVTAGISLEQGEQYVGGSAGSSVITAPAAFAGLIGTQLNNQTTNFNTPVLAPDAIGKVAFDPSAKAHVEVAGLLRTFRVINPATLKTNSSEGGGFAVNGNFELAKGLRLITNNFYGPGGGRYLFGQAPDLIIDNGGKIKTVLSRSTVDGFELTVKKTLWYAYYGGIFIDKTITADATGAQFGYGAFGQAQNRSIQEGTIGFNQTLYKNARYGALNLMGQYQYLNRNLWYVKPGTAKGAHDNTIYVNLRYTLPGDMPKF